VTIRSWFRRRRSADAAAPVVEPESAVEPQPADEPESEPDPAEPKREPDVSTPGLAAAPAPAAASVPAVDEAFVAAIAAWVEAQQVPGLPTGASPTFGDRAMVLQRARTLVAGIVTGQVPMARGRQALARLRKPIAVDQFLGPASATRDTPAGDAVAHAVELDRAAWTAVDDAFR
jgi:hypothetical protein